MSEKTQRIRFLTDEEIQACRTQAQKIVERNNANLQPGQAPLEIDKVFMRLADAQINGKIELTSKLPAKPPVSLGTLKAQAAERAAKGDGEVKAILLELIHEYGVPYVDFSKELPAAA